MYCWSNISAVAEVKRTAVRYTIQVLEQRIDPEFNPWGLYLDRIVRPAERLPKS